MKSTIKIVLIYSLIGLTSVKLIKSVITVFHFAGDPLPSPTRTTAIGCAISVLSVVKPIKDPKYLHIFGGGLTETSGMCLDKSPSLLYQTEPSLPTTCSSQPSRSK